MTVRQWFRFPSNGSAVSNKRGIAGVSYYVLMELIAGWNVRSLDQRRFLSAVQRWISDPSSARCGSTAARKEKRSAAFRGRPTRVLSFAHPGGITGFRSRVDIMRVFRAMLTSCSSPS